MSKKLHTTKLFKRLTWMVLGIAIVAILIAAISKSNSALCKNINVTIKENNNHSFITQKGVLIQINASSIINKKSIKDIDIKALELQIEQNVWVDNVDVYFTKNQSLQIDITQRIPLYRIYTKNGNSFYLDNKNIVLPLSDDYTAKLPLFTSFSNNKSWTNADSATLAATQVMATYITNNPFWMSQIQQIDIRPNDMFELVPTIGNHLIVFGDTVDMDSKFKKLEKFYKKVSAQVGFDKYAVLNVQFKNQIVASNNYNNHIDSVTAQSSIQAFLRGTVDSTFVTTDTIETRNDTTRITNNRNVVSNRTAAAPINTRNNSPINRNNTPIRNANARPTNNNRPITTSRPVNANTNRIAPTNRNRTQNNNHRLH